MRRPRAGVAAALIALAVLVGGGGAEAQEAPPALVKVDAVRREPLSQTSPVIGRLVARQAGVVAARVGGPVAGVEVEVGDRLQTGQVLATLVDDSLRATAQQRAAEVAESEARVQAKLGELALKRLELRRLEGLRKSAAFSQARYDDVRQEIVIIEGEVSEAQARLDRAKATLGYAHIDLVNAEVRAPYPGVVSLKHTVAGAYLDDGDPVVTLINDDALEIEADVPSTLVAALAPGTVVEARLDDDSRHDAVVRAIVPEENPLTRTWPVRFTLRLEETGRTLASNQSAVVYLPIGAPREVVSVHKDAVVKRRGEAIVYVLDGDAAQVRTIQLGEAVGGRFVVRSGLAPGDLVVVRGNERLLPGQRVQVEGQS